MIHTQIVQNSLPIHLLRSQDADGCACHFVIRTSASSLTKLTAVQGKSIDIRDYAEILFAGFGTDPLPSTREKIRVEFGVELPT